MTTEDTRSRRYFLTALTVVTAWFGGLGVLTLLAEPSTKVVIIAPGGTALRAAIASDVDLLDSGRNYIIVRSDRNGFVRDLYANGAWFVWPAIDGGCSSSLRQVPSA
jgi:hypothetical protein